MKKQRSLRSYLPSSVLHRVKYIELLDYDFWNVTELFSKLDTVLAG